MLNRYWLITDGDGNQKEVRGPGVVGNQPNIAPGEAFRYTSACVLETELGVMQGHYEFSKRGRYVLRCPHRGVLLGSART